MSNNSAIERMKQRAEAAKQEAASSGQEQPTTVAKTYRKPGSDLTAQINVRLTPEFRSELKAWCALNGTTIQELVPMLLEQHLRDNPLTS